MVYDDGLAHRVRAILGPEHEFEEREMFGGIGFMIGGNMCCGVINDRLIARVGPDSYEAALEEHHTTEFDYTGRPMRGWVFVNQDGLQTRESLEEWVRRCLAFVRTLQ